MMCNVGKIDNPNINGQEKADELSSLAQHTSQLSLDEDVAQLFSFFNR